MTPLDYALAYAARGWRVAPIPPGYKYPANLKNWQTLAHTDPDRLARYWGQHPDHGVCIVTGPESGVWALDIDPDHGGDDSLAAIEGRYGTLPDTVQSLTGGGGVHYLWRWPEGIAIQNNQSGLLGVGIDVRGIGGQIVVAPTIHPTTGHPYRWEIEHDPLDGVALADAPQWLLYLLTANVGDAEPRAPKRKRLGADPLPGDWWEAQTSWPAELARYGWSIHSQQHDAAGSYYELWTRPGKTPRDGASASLYWQGSDVLKVFSTSCAPLTADSTYSLWGFHVAMEHGGDFADAARKVRTTMPKAASSNEAPPNVAPPAAAATNVEPDELEEVADDDWAPIDLVELARQIRSGQIERTVPTILAVEGGMPLFYRERINSLFGESGGGKTWAALAAIAETLRLGDRALMVDYEDNPAGIAERLVLLGLTDDEIGRLDYRNPTTGIGKGSEQLAVEAGTYSLIVIDSTGEAMASGGIDSNADNEVAQWFALVKRLMRLPGGPAVIVLDHVPKDKDAPSSYAIGSQRKRAAVTGAAYRVDTLVEPARGRNGKLKLTVAKDRLGNRPKGSVACELHIKSSDDGVLIEAHLSDAQAAAAAGQTFRPTVLMERVSRFLETTPAPSIRAIERSVSGKGSGIRQAVECLITDGYVQSGPMGLTSLREYREPVDNTPQTPDRVPASPPRPTASRDAGSERVPASPPSPLRGGTRGTRTTGDAEPTCSDGERVPGDALAPEEPF